MEGQEGCKYLEGDNGSTEVEEEGSCLDLEGQAAAEELRMTDKRRLAAAELHIEGTRSLKKAAEGGTYRGS